MDQTPGLAASDKPFQVAYSMGRLYYAKGRFKEATAFLRQAVEKGEPLRKLYLEQRARAGKRGLPSPEKSACGVAADAALEEQEKAITARAKKDGLAAASCARLALGPVLDAEQMLAAALFITGDSAGARASLERILQVAPDDADALSAHGNILFETAGDDLRELKKARAEWERALAVRPGASTAERTRRLIARADAAIAAGGFSKLAAKERASVNVAAAGSPAPVAPFAAGAGSAPGGSGATATAATGSGSTVPAGAAAPPALSRETMEAFRNTKVTPEMEATFAKLIADAEDYLARGSYQQAMDNYRQVMPYQPENGRLRAGMAWALIGLNRQPMAENVWRVAVGSDPTAVEKLGETLQAKGDSRGAKALWGKLASSDPSYAERSGLKARLTK
jgi:tetratricopeptide (TPR) repeat protein